MPQHNALTGADLHEPKGVATAASDQVYRANGAGSGTWSTLWNHWWWNVDNSNLTPIALTSGVRTLLTNDDLGVSSFDFSTPGAVGDIWSASTNKFTWADSGAEVGDSLFMRIDLDITASTNNDTFVLEMSFGEGTGSQFYLPVTSPLNFDTAGTQRLTIPFNFFVGSDFVRNNPSGLYITSDSSGDTAFLRGFYIAVMPTKPRTFL